MVATFLTKRSLYWLDLSRRIRTKFTLLPLPAPMERSRQVAERWARAHQMPVDQALSKPEGNPEASLAKDFADAIKEAERWRKARHELMVVLPVGSGGAGSRYVGILVKP